MLELMQYFISFILTAIIILGLFYPFFCLLNFLMLFAFFQRQELTKSDKKAKEHYIYSTLLSLGGFFTTFQLVFLTSFPKYGLKFWAGEKERFSFVWYNRKCSLESESNQAKKFRNRVSNGRCKSIW